MSLMKDIVMLRAILLAGPACLLVSACGGGGSGASGSGAAAPAPNPAPAPAPTPPPSPAPAPSVDPGGAQIGGISVPGDLEGRAICSSGAVTRSNGRVTDVEPGPLSGEFLHIYVDSDFSYWPEIAFPSHVFRTANRLGGQAFEVFSDGTDELQLSKALTRLDFATYGLFTPTNLCFYALAMRSNATTAPGQVAYTGFVDGLNESGGDEDRLYGSTARLDFDGATKTYRLEIELRSVEYAFAEPAGQSQLPIGKAQAQLTLENGKFREAVLTGPAGYTGKVSGTLGGRLFLAGLFTFELTHPDGSRIWGVIATDGAQI